MCILLCYQNFFTLFELFVIIFLQFYCTLVREWLIVSNVLAYTSCSWDSIPPQAELYLAFIQSFYLQKAMVNKQVVSLLSNTFLFSHSELTLYCMFYIYVSESIKTHMPWVYAELLTSPKTNNQRKKIPSIFSWDCLLLNT